MKFLYKSVGDLSVVHIFFIILITIPIFTSSCRNIIPQPPESINKQLIIPDSYYSVQNNIGNYSDNIDGKKTLSKKYIDNNLKGKWWESFGNSELNSLIENAIGTNFSLKEAWAKLKQAKALENSQRSYTFPSINLNASVGHKAIQNSTSSGSANISDIGSSSESYNSFSAGPLASYEVDLWGKINAKNLEYENKTVAASFDLETAKISVAAEVANSWVELITIREEIALVKKQIEINSMLLELLEIRFQNSMSTALDVLQQREVVARSRAKIAPLEIRESNLLNAIALLSGKPSPKGITIKTPTLGEINPMPQIGIPAALLFNRPDIKSAESRLTASEWAVSQAKIDKLPSLNLNGSFLFQHTTLETILKNWIFSIASNINATLFDGGKNKAAIDLASAVMEERLYIYKKTVFNAIIEVENSITSEQYRVKWIDLLKAELVAAQLALGEARNRYIKGIDSFIQVVTEELNVQNLEMNLLEQKSSLFKDRIALYRAVGGTWTNIL
ncbi:MAG: efflux transporter outer membrane subunit [Desulfamplus sp.]|nr:efflux transporter outer membrane subunit [Desulfamplus sp.]